MRRCKALTLLTTRGLWQQQPALPARFPVSAGIRQLAHENILAIISEIDNKDLRLKTLTALLKEREQSQARVDKERQKSDKEREKSDKDRKRATFMPKKSLKSCGVMFYAPRA